MEGKWRFWGRLVSVCLGLFLAVTLTTPQTVAAAAHVYWTNYNTGLIGEGSIGRADLDGTNVNQNWITGCYQPYGVISDANYVYWTNLVGNTIGRANLDGSNVNQSWITGCNGPLGIAVDANYIYWTNHGGAAVGRANLDGTNVNQSWITASFAPRGIAINSNYVYWIDDNYNSMSRANLDGSNVIPNWIAAVNSQSVAVDASYVYWGNGLGIGRANLDGTGVNAAWISTPYVSGIAVDGSHVYWTVLSLPPYSLGRANLDGSGVVSDWITGCLYPIGISVSEDQLPMLTITKSGTGTGRITSSPAGIDCDLGCTQQSASFPLGTPVTLTAQVPPGSTFMGWTGGVCSGRGQCVVTVGSDITVGAQFTGQGPAKVPSLSEWGTIICAFLLAGSAIWLIRRRQRS